MVGQQKWSMEEVLWILAQHRQGKRWDDMHSDFGNRFPKSTHVIKGVSSIRYPWDKFKADPEYNQTWEIPEVAYILGRRDSNVNNQDIVAEVEVFWPNHVWPPARILRERCIDYVWFSYNDDHRYRSIWKGYQIQLIMKLHERGFVVENIQLDLQANFPHTEFWIGAIHYIIARYRQHPHCKAHLPIGDLTENMPQLYNAFEDFNNSSIWTLGNQTQGMPEPSRSPFAPYTLSTQPESLGHVEQYSQDIQYTNKIGSKQASSGFSNTHVEMNPMLAHQKNSTYDSQIIFGSPMPQSAKNTQFSDFQHQGITHSVVQNQYFSGQQYLANSGEQYPRSSGSQQVLSHHFEERPTSDSYQLDPIDRPGSYSSLLKNAWSQPVTPQKVGASTTSSAAHSPSNTNSWAATHSYYESQPKSCDSVFQEVSQPKGESCCPDHPFCDCSTQFDNGSVNANHWSNWSQANNMNTAGVAEQADRPLTMDQEISDMDIEYEELQDMASEYDQANQLETTPKYPDPDDAQLGYVFQH